MASVPPDSEAPSVLGRISREQSLRGARWVAEFLNVPQAWVEEAAATKVLPSVRVGDAVRFDPDVIRSWGRDRPERVSGGRYLPLLEELRADLKELKGKQKDAARLSELRLLSKAMAAARLAIGNETLTYLIRTRQLSTVRVGKRLKIPARDVEALSARGFSRGP